MKSIIRKHWREKPPIEQQVVELQRWFDSDKGQRVLQRETELVSEALTQAFGYHLLQLSADPRAELYHASRVQRKYRGHPFSSQADVVCLGEELPFANESLDVVILHHIQELTRDPHQLLREVQRVIVPHGQVLILGFNPWSPLGVYSAVRRYLPDSPWQNHWISARRIHDWLGLLGFETLQIDFGMTIPQSLPWKNRALVDSLWRNWPFGSFYLISAIKHVAAFTPQKPKWKTASNGFQVLSPVKTRPVANTVSRGEQDSDHWEPVVRFTREVA